MSANVVPHKKAQASYQCHNKKARAHVVCRQKAHFPYHAKGPYDHLIRVKTVLDTL